MSQCSLRLGFHCHIPALQLEGRVWMPAHMGLFVDSLAVRCERFVCFQHSPLADELYQMDYAVKSTNVRLVDIGPHTSIPLRTLVGFVRRRTFRDWESELDVLLVRAPTPLLPVVGFVWSKPIVLLLVGDYLSGVDDLPRPILRKELIRLWSRWIHYHQMRIAQRSLTFVNSRLRYEQLCRQIPYLVETRTTTLSENDFCHRVDTCSAAPYRLLYTGRMLRAKGLFEIVEALSQLVTLGFDVVLDLVGMTDKSDPVLDELDDLAHSLGVGERVQYHGYKTAGAELLAFYRRADIYVIASQISSEGFPRTIWEAMASSLPVVATQVGSIPAFISDAALLVPPKNVPALTQAVKSLLTEPDLRQRLIQRGMALARENTLERRAEEMIKQIEHWLDGKAGELTGRR